MGLPSANPYAVFVGVTGRRFNWVELRFSPSKEPAAGFRPSAADR
mgnify:CR=1 FL=1